MALSILNPNFKAALVGIVLIIFALALISHKRAQRSLRDVFGQNLRNEDRRGFHHREHREHRGVGLMGGMGAVRTLAWRCYDDERG
jgi:hypothetical protein